MEYALAVDGLTKHYPDFTLDRVSFNVPEGAIVGLIGENGAGKSTTISAILGLIQKDAGAINLFGVPQEQMDAARRERIGVVFDGTNFSEELSPNKLNLVLKDIYQTWDEPLYYETLQKMGLPRDKKIKTFSKGMKMKLSLTVAFSHHPQLLILDEATSGLDPVMRDDILDMFLEFVQKEENAILVSSHITSDLEKIADYIVFLHAGKIVFAKPKDELLEQFGILQCGSTQFDALDKADIVAHRKLDYEWRVLVSDRAAAQKKYPQAMITPATIDEIMLLHVKGDT